MRHAIESALLEELEFDEVPDYIGKHYPSLHKPSASQVRDYVSFHAKWLAEIISCATQKQDPDQAAQQPERYATELEDASQTPAEQIEQEIPSQETLSIF